MQRMFFVGCGGTGGAVLTYMMDQLRAEFRAAGLADIPAAWQFVHVDVPRVSDTRIPGLGGVPDVGGTYISVGPYEPRYSAAEQLVTSSLSSGGGSPIAADNGMGQLSSWLPGNPAEVRVPLDKGAGQLRGVGRIATLSNIKTVNERLMSAWESMSSMQARAEGAAAASAMPQLEEYHSNIEPIVMVVSSMAGGAGASMVLDICRLLSEIPGSNDQTTPVFLASSSVFGALPEGLRTGILPNALAMFGEIVAAQTGASRAADVTLLRGLNVGGGPGRDLPFTRVIPFGNTVGTSDNAAEFGDGQQDTVYRGLARAMAGLVSSDQALGPWMQFVVANDNPTPMDKKLFGWGGSNQALQWQGFGYASVAMGRERYLEYAAQRLSRTAVDHLVSGHFTTGDDTRSAEQAIRERVSNRWETVCRRLEIPPVSGREGEQAFRRWVEQVLDEAQDNAEALRSRIDAALPVVSGRRPAGQLREVVATHLERARPGLDAAARAEAYELVYLWAEAFVQRLEAVLAQEIAEAGLPYAQQLLESLTVHLCDGLAEMLDSAGRHFTSPVQPPEVKILSELKDSVDGGGVLSLIREKYVPFTRMRIRGEGALLLSDTLRRARPGLFTPMRAAVGEAVERLRSACQQPPAETGLAVLATASYQAWPSDGDERVNERWSASVNEVLLTPASTFQSRYDGDLLDAVDTASHKEMSVEAAKHRAVSSVIRGQWNVPGGREAPGGLLSRNRQWVPESLVRIPGAEDTRVAVPASYSIDTATEALLARSRGFVGRAGMSFRSFVDESLRSFVAKEGLSESERAQRCRSVQEAFAKALEAGRPLIKIDTRVVQALHQQSPLIHYEFSDIPFQGLQLAEDLTAALGKVNNVDPDLLQKFRSAPPFNGNPHVTKVDLFGSYRGYAPVAFAGVLDPIATAWSNTMQASRGDFWRMRRARPLPAALPITQVEREAMVGGWFVGQITGSLILPGRGVDAAVRVFDEESGAWLAFPHPMLRPPSSFRRGYDWLPAVMESMLLAITKFSDEPVGSSMAPYRALRQLWDVADFEPTNTAHGVGVLKGEVRLRDWMNGQLDVPGGRSAVPGLTAASSASERAEAGTRWIDTIRRIVGTDLSPSGLDGAPGAGAHSLLQTRREAAEAPLLRDLAPDVWKASGLIRQWLTPTEEEVDDDHF